MKASPLLVFHIGTAAVGLLSGAAALLFRKGSRLHRISGNVFFVSMLSMSASATYIAITKPAMISIVPGMLTFYLVATAWATVIRKEGETGLFEFGALLVALSTGTCGLILGWQPAHSMNGLDKDGFPAAAYFVFASVAFLAAALDVRLLVSGVFGAHRIARHLWRMCFSLLIASSSFFSGQAQVFPKAIRETHLLDLPTQLVAASLIFWLVRVLFTSRFKSAVTPRA